jgi:tRNA pseudouridine55 synthase
MQSSRNGLLVLDKPAHMTSRDAVNFAWRWLPRGTRIGHTGTLDPLATGVLVVCVGTATRLAEYVQNMEKVYRAGVLLGVRSTTDDGEGIQISATIETYPSKAQVERVLEGFIGTIEQVPPAHSAAKVSGRRAYALARQGREVSLAARSVSIYALTLLEYTYPRLVVEVRCGKGTYIRSLARDLGEQLGCGAYLESLRRTRVGHFLAEDGLSPLAEQETALPHLRPIHEAVQDLPQLTLNEDDLQRLQAGQTVPLPEGSPGGPEVALMSDNGDLVAVALVDLEKAVLQPRKVFGQEPRTR